MKIKMLQHVNGKVNGERMGPYYKDREYELDTERAELFIGSAMAEAVLDRPVIVDEESAGQAPADTVEVLSVGSEKPEQVSTRKPSRKRSDSQE